MIRKVTVQLVRYDSVFVEIDDEFSDNISEWTEDQQDFVTEAAYEEMYEIDPTHYWDIDVNADNEGFVEIVTINP